MKTHCKSNDKYRFRRKTVMRLFIPCLIFFFAAIACNNDSTSDDNPYLIPHRPGEPVVVSGIGPTSGGLGTKVVVNGENFGNDPEKIKLFFNEKEALILKVQDNAIYAMVPKQPGEFSTIRVEVEGKEGILEDVLFEYFIRETITTIAGVYMTQGSNDGPALEATFTRPAKVAANDDGDVLICDDQGNRVRFFSAQDNRVTTILTAAVRPWTSTMNTDYSYCYICERYAAQRPILFYGLSKESAYLESEIYFDQMDETGAFIFGARDIYGLTTDDTYVYVLSTSDNRLIRVHQKNKTVELIGNSIGVGNYAHLVYNKLDGMIYVAEETQRRLSRFDPYHTPADRTTPWITVDDIEWVAGTGINATAREGQGRDAQFSGLSGIGIDLDGIMYLSDYLAHVIWRVDRSFNCTFFAGTPTFPGYRDGKPSESQINRPLGMNATDDGLVYIADSDNRLVRVVSIQ